MKGVKSVTVQHDSVTLSIDAHLFVGRKSIKSVLLTHPGISRSLAVIAAVDGVAKSSTYGGHSCRHSGNFQTQCKTH